MDLQTVLADGTNGLGSAALARYFSDIFSLYLPPSCYPGAFRVRASLNTGVQQLATRSRVDRAHERFLQVGGFAGDDLAAALVEAMPHTDIDWQAGDTGPSAADILAVLSDLRRQLAQDAMPEAVRIGASDLPDGCFGFIALFATGIGLAPELYRRLLNPNGRMLLIHRSGPAIEPTLVLLDA